jgi:DNA modification methylase
VGDVRDTLERLAAEGETFDLVVTSPPFLALRSYLPADHPDKHREIGSEPTPAAFLDTCYGWTAQLGKVLPDWASICIELGDTMSGSGGAGGDYNADGLRAGQPSFKANKTRYAYGVKDGDVDRSGFSDLQVRNGGGPGWPLAKSMCILPHAYTLGLAYGHNPLTGVPHTAGQWRIRNVITWARPNPPVGSLGKRNPERRTGDYKFRPACSFITVACRGTGRYFDLDAVRTEHAAHTLRYPRESEHYTNEGYAPAGRGDGGRITAPLNPAGAPPLDWHTDQLDGDWLWKLATAPYRGAHYATYPLTLPRRLIAAMCPARVCTVCGWPSERITATISPRLVDEADAGKDRIANRTGGTFAKRHTVTEAETTTLGWTDCECGWEQDLDLDGRPIRPAGPTGTNWRTGRVIDIFGGSGTTAVAAALEHRDCTLIDLDPRNVDLVRRRLNEQVRIHNEVRDGDHIVWTVETVTTGELAADHAGQLTLLDGPAA